MFSTRRSYKLNQILMFNDGLVVYSLESTSKLVIISCNINHQFGPACSTSLWSVIIVKSKYYSA